MTTPERISEIYHRALERAPEERSAFLDEACAGDDTLRSEISLPTDPRERNFWSFYKNKWLSQQAQDYVASIFAAALVCEEPETFNFPVEKIW